MAVFRNVNENCLFLSMENWCDCFLLANANNFKVSEMKPASEITEISIGQHEIRSVTGADP